MSTYKYEFTGTFNLPNGGTRSNVTLGTTHLDDREIPSGSAPRKDYLLAIAATNFPGKIARNGDLTNVNIIKREKVKESSGDNGLSDYLLNTTYNEPAFVKSGSINIVKVFIGLGLFLFVWMFFYMIDIIKSIYWVAPKKTWNWYRNFIRN